MPHITKWQEKRICIKPKMESWQEDLKLKYLPVTKEAVDAYKTTGNMTSLYKIIEKAIDDLLPKTTDEWFNKFVEAKKLDDYISF